MGYEIVRLDHVQLAMPRGREAEAEQFYSGLLGLERLPKPEPQASRGGCWFSHGPVALHLGVEEDFRPTRRGWGAPGRRSRRRCGPPAWRCGPIRTGRAPALTSTTRSATGSS